MAYNNQNSGYSFDRPSYNRGNFGHSLAPYNQGYQAAPKKHSGSRFITKEDGAHIVSGWNYSRSRGMITLYARPYKGTKKIESKNGKRWMNLFVTIVFRKTGQILKTSGMLDCDGRRLYVKELNMIATSRGKGGYFGQHIGGGR